MTGLARPLVLASASPRRHELLAALGVEFSIVVTDGEERTDAVPQAITAALPPFPLLQDQHPTLLAWRKAQAAAADAPTATILGADTIVVLDDQILGKPKDPAHARAMLRKLAGRQHRVYTGVVLLAAGYQPFLTLDQADVRLQELDDATIAAYVASGEPLDKAGAYGIQGLGGQLVQSVEGSFTAVVGLPLPTTERLLRTAGISTPRSAEEAWKLWRLSLAKEPQCTHRSAC